jgi:hypothetical protein
LLSGELAGKRYHSETPGETETVHRGMEIRGITGYTGLQYRHNNPMKEGLVYQVGKDCFTCGRDKELPFSKLIYKKGTG